MNKHHVLAVLLVVAMLTSGGSIAAAASGVSTTAPASYVSFAAAPSGAPQQQYADGLFEEMRWRNIGPFRGGRTKAAGRQIHWEGCTLYRCLLLGLRVVPGCR